MYVEVIHELKHVKMDMAVTTVTTESELLKSQKFLNSVCNDPNTNRKDKQTYTIYTHTLYQPAFFVSNTNILLDTVKF